jgi:tetratricopeptide (TPR) repeat protein
MKLHYCYMSEKRWALRDRATALAAITDPLPQALWAEFVETFQLQRVMNVPLELESRGMLSGPTKFERSWLNTPIRLALEIRLSDQDPLIWKKAHELSARFFAKRQRDDDLAREVEHWLCIGERRRALQSVEKFSRTNVDAHWSAGSYRAVLLVVQGMGDVPPWLHIVQAKILERNGSLEKALEVHDSLLAQTTNSQTFDETTRIRLAASAGQIALRLGQVRRAKRFYDLGMALAKSVDSPELFVLDARLALARQDLVRAQRMFRKAEKVADRMGEPEQRAEARSGQGVLAMRMGKPHDAIHFYRRALSACGGETSRKARILANLAMALTLTGEYEEAIELFEEAIRMRDRFGEVLGVANSLAALASAREAFGDKKGATRDLARARHLATRADDLGLVLEIHLLQTLLALRHGEVSAARTHWQKASALHRSLEHVDPLVMAMMDETCAELELSRSQFVKAHNHARAALRILRKNAAHYWVTRVYLFLARLTFQAHRHPAALRHLDVVAHSVAKSKFVFPMVNIPSRLLHLGTQSSSEITKRFCRTLLGTPHSQPRILPIARPGSANVRIHDRTGPRWADERHAHALRQNPPEILLDGPRHHLIVRGNVTDLGAKRILAQLLRLFLEHPTRSFEAWEIHREVWEQDIFNDSSALRVRVALSRLRNIIGKNTLLTKRLLGATGEITTCYSLSPNIDYATIEFMMT